MGYKFYKEVINYLYILKDSRNFEKWLVFVSFDPKFEAYLGITSKAYSKDDKVGSHKSMLYSNSFSYF